jgi:hypothetical protein
MNDEKTFLAITLGGGCRTRVIRARDQAQAKEITTQYLSDSRLDSASLHLYDPDAKGDPLTFIERITATQL